MKIIGIIAEYNPFHNGHAYQIKKIKEELQADFVVVAMSGDFVQRGAPAIIDKYARTKMALSCGADLVIELPVLWATASAEYFAMAGVTLFDKMGCVDGICFGAETDDIDTLSMLADILVTEPETYRKILSTYLKEGLAFPVARSKALCEYLTQAHANNDSTTSTLVSYDLDFIATILNEPNNILAIEYLKALKRRHSSMTPYVIKREGAGYHEDHIADIPDIADIISCSNIRTASPPTASATGIRKLLSNNNDLSSQDYDALISAMPMVALNILNDYQQTHSFVFANDFSSILGYRLLSSDACILSDIGDSNNELANRLFKNRMYFSSFDQCCDRNKSKDVTYSRISRILLHLILNIHNQDYSFGKELDYIPYLRMLGFRTESSTLLKECKKTSQVPLISKLADASALLSTDALVLLEKDIFAADLYSQICACKNNQAAQSEYSRNIVRM